MGDIIIEGCAVKIVTTIWNGIVSNTIVDIISSGLVEVSHTEINITLVVFDNEIFILTGAYDNTIDLCNNDIIAHLKNTPLLWIYDNYLLYAAQDCDFGMDTYYVANNYSGNQYNNYGNEVILIKFYKALINMAMMYVNIQEYTQWGINNLTHTITTL